MPAGVQRILAAQLTSEETQRRSSPPTVVAEAIFEAVTARPEAGSSLMLQLPPSA